VPVVQVGDDLFDDVPRVFWTADRVLCYSALGSAVTLGDRTSDGAGNVITAAVKVTGTSGPG
jgi:hypothetical protein